MKRKGKKGMRTLLIIGLMLLAPLIGIILFAIVANVPIPFLPGFLQDALSDFQEMNANYTYLHQNEDGVFVEPSVAINYYAQGIIDNASSPPLETGIELYQRDLYMDTHVNLDSGFSEIGGAGDVITTYKVLRYFQYRNSSFFDDPANIQKFENTSQFLNASFFLGGYASRPGSVFATVETTYSAVKSLLILNATFNSTEQTLLGGFLLGCHNLTIGTSGFYTALLSNDTNIKATHYGIELVRLFGLVWAYNDSIFVDNCQNPDGGFGFQPGRASTVESTYHGIMGLAADGLQPANLTGAPDFIKSAQNEDGGFGNQPGEISEFPAAFHAFIGHNATGTPLPAQNETDLLDWLNINQGLNGLYGDLSVRANYWALSTFVSTGRTGRLTPVQTNQIAQFVNSCQNVDGGFGSRPGLNSTVFDAFCAIESLSMLEGIDRGIRISNFLSSSLAISWIRSLQNPDGGFSIGANMDLFWDYMSEEYEELFEGTIDENMSLSVSTYWAFSSLRRLNSYPNSLTSLTLWMKSLQNLDGGFGATTGLWSEVVSSYYIIKAFSLYEETIDSVPSAVDYLKNSQNEDGGFNLFTIPLGLEIEEIRSTYLFISYCAAEGLYLLNSQPGQNIFDFISLGLGAFYVITCAFPIRGIEYMSGGFGDIPYFGADIRNAEMGITLLNNITVNQGLMAWAQGWLILLVTVLILLILSFAAWYGYQALKIIIRKIKPLTELEFREKLKDRVAVKCQGVTIKAGSKVIIDNVSLSVNHGEILGVIGESGAGKSTFIRSLIGTIDYIGEVTIYDMDSKKDKKRLKPLYGYVPQDLSKIYEDFTVSENLLHFGKEYGLSEVEIMRRSRKILLDLGISEKEDELVRNLSGGQKRRVSIAIGMIHHPVLFILDEPTSGLDPVVRDQLWYALMKVSEEYNTTLIVITHYPEDSRFCDKIAIFGRKRGLIDFGDPSALYQNLPGRGRALDVQLRKGESDILLKLRQIPRFDYVLEIKRNEVYRILTDLTSVQVVESIERYLGMGLVIKVDQKETIMADLFRMKSLEVKIE